MTDRGSFIALISSDALDPYRRYLWVGIVISFILSLASSLVYPVPDSAGGWAGAFASRFVALSLLSLIALGAHQLRFSIMRWRETLKAAGFPSLGQTLFLLECKAGRQSYADAARRQLARFGPLLGMEDEDEEDVLADAERLRVFTPVIFLCLIPLLAGLAGILVALFVFHGSVSLLLLSIALLVWGSRIGLDFVLPPTVLFLAASQEQQYELQAKLAFLCFPLYMISFLDTGWIYDERGAPKTPFHGGMLYSALRVSDGSDWETAVRRWLEIIPLAIVDCRVLSPAVTQEVEWIVSSRLFHKAVFVIASSDVPLPPEAIWSARVLTEDELMEYMSRELRFHLSRLRGRPRRA